MNSLDFLARKLRASLFQATQNVTTCKLTSQSIEDGATYLLRLRGKSKFDFELNPNSIRIQNKATRESTYLPVDSLEQSVERLTVYITFLLAGVCTLPELKKELVK